MSTTTTGQISMTPVLIRTSATLQAISRELESRRYQAEPGEPGWGSVRDGTDDIIGDLLSRGRRGGRPEPILKPESYPDQLRARLYWDEADRSLIKAFGLSAPAEQTNRLRAADITFAEHDEGQLMALLGDRNEAALRAHIIPEIRDTLEAIDPRALVIQDDNPLAFGDDDFFRWILFRATHDHELSDDLDLIGVRAMSTQDRAYRLASLSRGVELDRPELLALVGQASNRFGPAKFLVYSTALGLAVSLEVAASGQFSIYRGGTEYDLGVDEEEASQEELGLRLVQDVAFSVLPELKRLHTSDSAWRDHDRDAFTQEARRALRESLD